ncbi:IS200/IS605 family transposase [Taibaiella helva]|uniref:IS200/IS605 family transposase n=1 Tax=Taibaiella helva TaxID=2301235 RepID=UPI000E59060F|nr:IS200/IS605 family transposase [Taibaiella helva]
MSNTYTQLYIQFVFAVKYRQALIDATWEERLRSYITGIVQNHKHKMLAINNMPDHLHLFVGLHPSQSISDLMRVTKGDSSEWINANQFTGKRFSWQEGYGAFSYSRSHIDNVVQYIHQQKEHHRKTTFKDEYKALLEQFGIAYEEQYIFHDPI